MIPVVYLKQSICVCVCVWKTSEGVCGTLLQVVISYLVSETELVRVTTGNEELQPFLDFYCLNLLEGLHILCVCVVATTLYLARSSLMSLNNLYF